MKKLIILISVVISLVLGIYFGSILNIQKSKNPYHLSFQGNGGGTDGTGDGINGDGDDCVPECIAHDCTRTTTFKFKVDITITATQKDKYSVVPGVEKTGIFPVKINASFAEWEEIKDVTTVYNTPPPNNVKNYLPIWFIDGKYYVYGDSQPKEKFILLAVKPSANIKEKYEYVLWENGISINDVIGVTSDTACYKSVFKYKDDSKQPITIYSIEEKTVANRLISEKKDCEGWIKAAQCYLDRAFDWFTKNAARILEKFGTTLNLGDGWYLDSMEEVNPSNCQKIDASNCNFFDGSQCRKIPYSLNYETFKNEKIPYDWLQFIFKFKHYSEWVK